MKYRFIASGIEVIISVISSIVAKKISLKYDMVSNWGSNMMQYFYPVFTFGLLFLSIICIILAIRNLFLIWKEYRALKVYIEEKNQDENLKNLKKKIKKKYNT